MILNNKKKLLVLVLFAAYQLSHAQGGGPPMITDDPGTPQKQTFELNISVNSHISELEKEYEIPLIDLNYGLNERTQLKFEIPYLSYSDTKDEYNKLGSPILGVKYRFLDEEKSKISISAYPQITIPINSEEPLEYLLPMQFEKSFGLTVTGCEMGFGWTDQGYRFLKSGIIAGRRFGDKYEAMLELAAFYDASSEQWDEIIVNAGARYLVTKCIIIIVSAGYDLNESKNLQTLLGVQFLF